MLLTNFLLVIAWHSWWLMSCLALLAVGGWGRCLWLQGCWRGCARIGIPCFSLRKWTLGRNWVSYVQLWKSGFYYKNMFSIKIHVDMLCDKEIWRGFISAWRQETTHWQGKITTHFGHKGLQHRFLLLKITTLKIKEATCALFSHGALAVVWVRCEQAGSALIFSRQGEWFSWLMVIAELSCLLLCFEAQAYYRLGLFERRLV